MEPWASVHAQRFGFALAALLIAALIDIRIWMRAAVPIYFVALTALVAVSLIGMVGGGARRWLAFAEFQLQPSELMKLALILVLARYYQAIDSRTVSRPARLVLPVLLMAIPAALVLRQPDLGTAMLLLAGSAAVMYAAGVHWLYFAAGVVAAGIVLPFGISMLHGYQQARILTFIDPSRDPLGAGYHIIQSKIALGSGGLFGKGYVQGTQNQLNFIPEKHTDFIFALIGEEFGFVGAVAVIGLFMVLMLLGIAMATRVKNRFGRLVSIGVIVTLFLSVFVNIGMVTGLLPVVGVPLPLVSYGGTAMVTLMIGFGILMSAHIGRDRAMRRPLARQ